MKSLFYLSMVAAGLLTVQAQGQSLYSLAGPVGLEESLPLKWSFSVSGGYDDNVNASNRAEFQDDSAFIMANVGVALANYDSITQYSFKASLGAIFYLKDMEGDTNETLSNSTLSANLSHSFSPTLRYSGSFSLAWQPEPNYSNGIANSRRQGDYIYGHVSSSLSKAWTTRWSTTGTISYSTLQYQEEASEIDNRDYITLGVNNRFKWTERLALSLNYRLSFCQREYGSDEHSNYLLAGVEYALDQYTTATLRVGPQFKYVDHYGSHTYPSAEFGLNHRMTDRFSLGMFVRYSNEATDTYRGVGSTYSSNESWRVGINSTFKLTHRVSLNAGLNLVNADYSRSRGMTDTTTLTVNAYAGVSMMLTNVLSLDARYSYTHGQYSGYSYDMPGYDRNVFSFGMSYSF